MNCRIASSPSESLTYFAPSALTIPTMKYYPFTLIILLMASCGTSKRVAPDQLRLLYHKHTLFESWRLASRECCGRASRKEYILDKVVLTFRPDSTYHLESVKMGKAESEGGQVQFQQKGGTNYLKLGYNQHWAAYHLSGDTLVLDYTYMDLQKEKYLATDGHSH
jgi:hypothetical protein